MSGEAKVIGGITLATIIILVGGVFLLTKSENPNVPEDQIVVRAGLHWHPKVTVTIKGEKQEIPANLGIGAVHSKIHTHDTDNKQGVIHMEIKGIVTKDDTRLARFFQVWGKEFNANKLFDKTSGSDGTVKMLVNGQENKEFENYKMRDGDNIEIKYE